MALFFCSITLQPRRSHPLSSWCVLPSSDLGSVGFSIQPECGYVSVFKPAVWDILSTWTDARAHRNHRAAVREAGSHCAGGNFQCFSWVSSLIKTVQSIIITKYHFFV